MKFIIYDNKKEKIISETLTTIAFHNVYYSYINAYIYFSTLYEAYVVILRNMSYGVCCTYKIGFCISSNL